MEYEELVRKLGYCSVGNVLSVSWDRGNGELSEDYVYFGKEDEEPILKRFEEGKSLEDYVNVASFDVSNPDLNIIDVRVIGDYFEIGTS